MDWRPARQSALRRNFEKYDAAEAASYQQLHGMGFLDPGDRAAYLSDLCELVDFRPGISVLDAGAGTGAMCKVLASLPDVMLTALEPSSAMLGLLRKDPELSDVCAVEGTCDDATDIDRFAESSFDVIIARQAVNSLFDPLVAFRNWHHWLKDGGALVVIEGLYGRDAWTADWKEEVDVLPLSASQSRATIAYLLESVGFCVKQVDWMKATNQRRCTKTTRYTVLATKVAR